MAYRHNLNEVPTDGHLDKKVRVLQLWCENRELRREISELRGILLTLLHAGPVSIITSLQTIRLSKCVKIGKISALERKAKSKTNLSQKIRQKPNSPHY